MKAWRSSILILTLLATPSWADDKAPSDMSAEMQAMMSAWEKAGTPGAQQAQLADHFAGTWTAKQSMWMDPAGEPMVGTGRAVSTAMFGGRHIRMEFEGEAMGEPFNGLGLTGYDNTLGRYYSSWIDSMGTGIMLAYGEYDAASTTYTFRTEMADPMNPGSKIPMRNVIRIIDADHHVFDMHETHDGKEIRTMMIEYSRAK